MFGLFVLIVGLVWIYREHSRTCAWLLQGPTMPNQVYLAECLVCLIIKHLYTKELRTTGGTPDEAKVLYKF